MSLKLEALDRRSKWFSLGSIVLMLVPYFAVNARYVLSDKVPTHDSGQFHFAGFQAIAQSIQRDHCFPQCFWVSGGTRLSYTHISFFHFVPHRCVGYLLYVVLPASPGVIYKLQLLVGMAITAVAWWLVLKRWFGSSLAACFGAQMILMGGTGISLHQEQVWSTVHLIPWLILALQNLKADAAQIVAVAAILGLGLATHQPQIQLISMGVILLAASCYYPPWKLRALPITRLHLAWCCLVLLLGVLPSAYLFLQMGELSSPIRGSDKLTGLTYEEYKTLNLQQVSSMPPPYFKQYAAPEFYRDDCCAIFVGRVGLALAVVGVLAGGRRMLPVLGCLLVFSLLSIGINSPIPLPKILFTLRFPLIDSFRQWYHFFPMMNFCLSILACFGIQALFRLIPSYKGAFIVVGILLTLQIVELSWYCQRYVEVFAQGAPSPRHEESLFSRDYVGPAALFTYKSRYLAQRGNPNMIPTRPADRAPHLHVTQYSIQDQGLTLRVHADRASQLTVPLNYDLGWNATVDGSPAEVQRVNDALSAVVLSAGEHEVWFRPQRDMYGPIVLVQLLLYAWIFVRVGRFSWRHAHQGDADHACGNTVNSTSDS